MLTHCILYNNIIYKILDYALMESARVVPALPMVVAVIPHEGFTKPSKGATVDKVSPPLRRRIFPCPFWKYLATPLALSNNFMLYIIHLNLFHQGNTITFLEQFHRGILGLLEEKHGTYVSIQDVHILFQQQFVPVGEDSLGIGIQKHKIVGLLEDEF